MKVVQIISEHKQKKSKTQVEAIVKLEDGRLVTRHIQASEAVKAEEKE